MNHNNYQILLTQSKMKKSQNVIAGTITFLLLFSTLFFIYLSSISHGITWFLFQLFLSINILQWFFLLHDLAHDKYFSNSFVNIFCGHIASLFSIVPFFPWKYIHRHHHLWTGYKDKDPTQLLLTLKDIPKKRAKIINFCWKYWLPICTLSFSFNNFWNLRKLKFLYPKMYTKNIFSILFIIFFHLLIIIALGPAHYLKFWGLAYLMFLIICDPLLLSQHAGKKQMLANGQHVSIINFKDQGQYTRSLKFPRWIEKYILMGFNKHTLHHLIPTLPGYHLIDFDFNDPDAENWWVWFKWAKSLPGVELLYSEELNLK